MKKLLGSLGIGTLVLFLLTRLSPGQEDELEPGGAINGAWRWTFTMPDGSQVRPKLILTNQNGVLTGVTSFRPGSETPITNGFLNADRVHFQVVRPRGDMAIVTSYSGRWQGRVIKGTIESNWAGEPQTFPWEAERSHLGIEGVWHWTNSFTSSHASETNTTRRGNRPPPEVAMRVELAQDGTNVTGKVLSRFARGVLITDGSIVNGEVEFQTATRFRDIKTVTRYKGKQTGETISGTVEMETNGRARKGRWEGRRID